MLHLCTQYPDVLLQDTFACGIFQPRKGCYAATCFCWREGRVRSNSSSSCFTETRGRIFQPTWLFQGLRKSLAVARNPRRHIFNLPLSHHLALTWITFTTVYLPSSPFLANVIATWGYKHVSNSLPASRRLFDLKGRHERASHA